MANGRRDSALLAPSSAKEHDGRRPPHQSHVQANDPIAIVAKRRSFVAVLSNRDWPRLFVPDDTKLVWARAEGTPWKQICWRFGISRATAHRRWRYALSLIAYRLNGGRLTMKRLRRFATTMADGF